MLIRQVRRGFLILITVSLVAGVITVPVMPLPVRAQTDTCPELVRKAIDLTQVRCARTGRNRLCYGNSRVRLETKPDVSDLFFAKPGDTADIRDVRTIHLGAFDPATEEWGISILRLQASLPDTAPDENVTLILFGDVELRDSAAEASSAAATSVVYAGGTATAIEAVGQMTETTYGEHMLLTGTKMAETELANLLASATAYATQTPTYGGTPISEAHATNVAYEATSRAYVYSTGVAIRLATATHYSATPDPDQFVLATSESIEQTWIAERVASLTAVAQLGTADPGLPPADATQTNEAFGYLATEVAFVVPLRTQQHTTPTAIPSPTPPILTTAEPLKVFQTMQGFYFRSGEGSLCHEAPRDGILIQTPQGRGKIELFVNGANIRVGSTVFLQAQPNKELIINTLDGAATVTSAGKTSTATMGTRVRVPLDSNWRASGPPSDPEPFDPAHVLALPVQLLPTAAVVPPPAVRIGTQKLISSEWGDICLTTGISVEVSVPHKKSVGFGELRNTGAGVKAQAGGEWRGYAGTNANFTLIAPPEIQNPKGTLFFLYPDALRDSYLRFEHPVLGLQTDCYTSGRLLGSGSSIMPYDRVMGYTFTQDEVFGMQICTAVEGIPIPESGDMGPWTVQVRVSCEVPATPTPTVRPSLTPSPTPRR
ncbi:hypothetical protein ANRL4_01175 [Anaerolineae bacterium]|nr:hypothetical protein ANRL4_01175 [Anaerolineae bacterium]